MFMQFLKYFSKGTLQCSKRLHKLLPYFLAYHATFADLILKLILMGSHHSPDIKLAYALHTVYAVDQTIYSFTVVK